MLPARVFATKPISRLPSRSARAKPDRVGNPLKSMSHTPRLVTLRLGRPFLAKFPSDPRFRRRAGHLSRGRPEQASRRTHTSCVGTRTCDGLGRHPRSASSARASLVCAWERCLGQPFRAPSAGRSGLRAAPYKQPSRYSPLLQKRTRHRPCTMATYTSRLRLLAVYCWPPTPPILLAISCLPRTLRLPLASYYWPPTTDRLLACN